MLVLAIASAPCSIVLSDIFVPIGRGFQEYQGSFENRVGQDAQAAPPRSLAALIAWMLFVAGGGSRSRVSTA
jgi:hypothetical protein